MNGIKNILRVIKWSIKNALEIDKKVFISWVLICLVFAAFPTICLRYQQSLYRSILENLSNDGDMMIMVGRIVILFLLLFTNGVVAKLDKEYLQNILGDTYNVGMEKIIIDTMREMSIDLSLDKTLMDEYRYIKYRFTAFNSLITNLLIVSKNCIYLFFIMVLIYGYSPKTMFVSLFFIILCIAINMKISKKAYFNYVTFREAEIKTHHYEESVMSYGIAKEIRLFGTRCSLKNNWKKVYMPIFQMEKSIGIWKFINALSCGVLYLLFSIAVLCYSIFLVINAKMTLDVFIVLYSCLKSISQNIVQLSTNIQNTNRDIKDMEHVIIFFNNIKVKKQNEKKIMNDKKAKTNPIIEVNNLHFHYPRGRFGIENINMRIERGEIIALLGENGCGKTTLVNIIIGLLKPQNGELFFDGINYNLYKQEQIAERFGIFFQNGELFHATVRENVGFGCLQEITNEDKIKAAMKKGMFDTTNNLDEWIMKAVKKNGLILSGGEKQKLGVSRAFMGEKEVLIFDEPSSALDPISEYEQFEKIRKQKMKETVILISHRVGFARLADRIFVMEKGKIVEEGTHEKLIEKRGFYYEMFQEQAKWYIHKEK